MSVTGYSDRINHALAYAAKHHAQEVWKGSSRVPYFTYPANVAIILTRYGQDDDTVVAGVLHEVVSDCMRAGQTREMLQERVGTKFGPVVLDALLSIAERKTDDDGVELSIEERKADVLDRVVAATDRARWIVAATTLHTGGSLLADLRRTAYPETVWGRFSGERDEVVAMFRRTVQRLGEGGFVAPIMSELTGIVDALERLATEADTPAPRLAR
ncbi:MAG: HD domain-containing protein [Gemmatimonadaceae bacterium]|nr:HD domain-containing protein [Gemmatimonadaceae bacterium]